MTARRSAVVCALVAALALLLAGCRGGADSPAPPAPGGSADPVSGVDATLDELERQLVEDSRADG